VVAAGGGVEVVGGRAVSDGDDNDMSGVTLRIQQQMWSG
jgi:hypothetical protein